MKLRYHQFYKYPILAAAILSTAQAQVTGLRQHQVIPMSVGSGEVVSFSPTQDTLAVTDNYAGVSRLYRHTGTAFSNHATVDVAAWRGGPKRRQS
jgi:hypothetical protein